MFSSPTDRKQSLIARVLWPFQTSLGHGEAGRHCSSRKSNTCSVSKTTSSRTTPARLLVASIFTSRTTRRSERAIRHTRHRLYSWWGWLITKFDRTIFGDDELKISLPFNRVIIERDFKRELVYYWFVQRGRSVANEYWSKWLLFTDAFFKNRTDGALVRLTTPISAAEPERAADLRLQSFIRELEPRLVNIFHLNPVRTQVRISHPAGDRS